MFTPHAVCLGAQAFQRGNGACQFPRGNTHTSSGWPSGSQFERQLRNICHCCGWPAYSHLDVTLWALPLWASSPRSFSFKCALSSWPAKCLGADIEDWLVVGFSKNKKHPKNFLTHFMAICCTIHWVVKNLHCYHENCDSIIYFQDVLFSFLALL